MREYTKDDYMDAVERYLYANAKSAGLSPLQKGDTLYYCDPFGDSDSRKCSWKNYGWSNVKTGQSGTFNDFARAAGYNGMNDMMKDWGADRSNDDFVAMPSVSAPKTQLVAPKDEISTESLSTTFRNLSDYKREKVKEFLAARGGIPSSKSGMGIIYSDLETVSREEIAWAPEWKRKLYGLHKNRGGAIMFPVHDVDGNVRSYQAKYEVQGEGQPKYSLLPGTHKSAEGKEYHFGCPKIDLSANTIVITEGAMDTWAVRNMMTGNSELDPAEGTITIGAIDAGGYGKMINNLTGYKGRVIVLADNDKAGMDAGDKLEMDLIDEGIDYMRIDWTELTTRTGAPADTKDIGDLIKATSWTTVRAALRMMVYGDAKQYTVDDSAVDWDAIWAVRDANNQYNEDDTQLAA